MDLTRREVLALGGPAAAVAAFAVAAEGAEPATPTVILRAASMGLSGEPGTPKVFVAYDAVVFDGTSPSKFFDQGIGFNPDPADNEHDIRRKIVDLAIQNYGAQKQNVVIL